VEACAKIPFVRGIVIWVRFGDKVVLGCVGCTRLEAYRQTGLSLLIGWFSPIAMIINPFMVAYGLVRGLFIQRNIPAARAALTNLGYPTGVAEDTPRACYALAVSLFSGVGQKEGAPNDNREVTMNIGQYLSAEQMARVSEIGTRIVPGFDSTEFETYVTLAYGLEDPALLVNEMWRVIDMEKRLVISAFLSEVAATSEIPDAWKSRTRGVAGALAQSRT
jgi:hypothetical protein